MKKAFRALNGSVSSGPSDSWITPDGAHLYQIYGNAAQLVGYATRTVAGHLHTRDFGEGAILMRVAELRAALNGQLVSPNDVGYDAARRIWNGAIDHHPALIVRCASVADGVRNVLL